MSLYNYLLLTTTCPRCGAEGEMEAEFRFGYRNLTYYRLGDSLLWDGMGIKNPRERPAGGDYDDEAYVVCPFCERDFWLRVSVRNDLITSASVDSTREPYIPDAPVDNKNRPDGKLQLPKGEE
jgi:hypothetical protein